LTDRREELLQILKLLIDENLTWFELRTPTVYIRLGNVPEAQRLAPVEPTDGLRPMPAPAVLAGQASAGTDRPAPAASGPAGTPAPAAAVPAIAVAGDHVIAAPFVGVFYRRPSPDQPPFVEVGDRVKAGDTVCLIEVMKLFNSITAGVDGTVTAIEAEDATLVEYGQVLMRIAPDRSPA
jgi:acetyl-CoA carboxylase biotin carboxyl carrier protein